jgi:endonuclease/exonuclease/phosphatase (EEP) superfamily protein YafD
VRDAGYDGWLAGSFTLNGHETGVLSAARVAAASACVQRAFEPLLQLPKAAAITRYEIGGSDATLAVANVHAINFTLGLGEYRAQLQAVAHELADHRGPMIVAGDFNSWSVSRVEVLSEVMRGLGLAEVLPETDTRSRFMGQQLDHVYVRGLDVVNASAPQVLSSDHNPVLATLRLAGVR